jgi:hypothetical protein
MIHALKTWRARVAPLAALFLTFTAPLNGATPPHPVELTSQGVVWKMMYTRVYPGKMAEYLEQVKDLLVPVLEEDKRLHGLLDYKIMKKVSQHGGDDWNLAVIAIFSNYAQMDDVANRWNAIERKLGAADGSKKYADRNTLRVDVGNDFLEELKFN